MAVNVAIQDLAITNAKAQGGGGAGLRGAIFVANLYKKIQNKNLDFFAPPPPISLLFSKRVCIQLT